MTDEHLPQVILIGTNAVVSCDCGYGPVSIPSNKRDLHKALEQHSDFVQVTNDAS